MQLKCVIKLHYHNRNWYFLNYFNYLCSKDTKNMIKKGFFDKVFEPRGTIPSTSLRGSLREMLFAYIEQECEMKTSTFMNRLFVIGFDMWQIVGIEAVKDGFAKQYPKLAEWRDEGKPFLKLVEDHGVSKMAFYGYLSSLGFCSSKVAKRRFENEKWKAWELQGIKKLLGEFEKRV